MPEHRLKQSNSFAIEKKNKYSMSSNDSSTMYRSDSSDIDDIHSHQGSRYGSIMTCGSIDEERSDENGMKLSFCINICAMFYFLPCLIYFLNIN